MLINIPFVAFPSFLTIATAILVGFGLLLYCLRKFRNQTAKSFFIHYTIGFFILAFTPITSFLINLGINISYNLYLGLFVIAFFATVFSLLLFYRGTILLLTKNKFQTTIFPIIFLLFFIVIILTALFVIKIELFTIITIIFWGFLLPLRSFLGFIFLYFFIKGIPFDTARGGFHTLLLSFAWFASFALDIFLWFSLATSSQEFWALRLASFNGWYIAKTSVYFLTLVAFLFYSRHLQHLSMSKKS